MEYALYKKHSTVRAYWELTKPRLWIMLTYTAAIGFLASLKVQPAPWVDGLIAVTAVGMATAGANVLTCYLDRDIDSIMERTKHRPLPTGRVRPTLNALYFGLTLVSVSLLILLALAKYIAALIGVFGLVDNVLVYSAWLKRRTSLNIILGGFSGGAPVLAGWAVNASILTPVPFLMAAVVVLWIPSHIWSLAFKYRTDYSKAGIPMLTSVVSPKNAIRCVASTSILMFVFSLLLWWIGPFSFAYFVVALASGTMLIALTIWMITKPYGRAPFTLFKYTSPYLAILLFMMAI